MTTLSDVESMVEFQRDEARNAALVKLGHVVQNARDELRRLEKILDRALKPNREFTVAYRPERMETTVRFLGSNGECFWEERVKGEA